MNQPDSIENKTSKRLLFWQKYLLKSFYFLFIGFAITAIWIRFDNLSFKNDVAENYSFHTYEEGFEAVSVTVPMPRAQQKRSLLDRLARRGAVPQIENKPVRDETAVHSWQKYAAKPVLVPENNAKIILVIDDLGIVKGLSKQIIDMDVPLTLSFLPYASGVSDQVNDAYDKGHDILVHIPMETKGDADPGPHALLSSETPKQQRDDIDYNFNQFAHYIGINNHMGSAFTEDEAAVNRLLDVVKDKGLFVLDSKTTSKSRLEDRADAKNIPVINRDVFLDNQRDVEYIIGQLEKLEKMAKSNGTALAIGHPYKVTVTALQQWLPTLKDKGITIVPISQSIKEKYASTVLAAKLAK